MVRVFSNIYPFDLLLICTSKVFEPSWNATNQTDFFYASILNLIHELVSVISFFLLRRKRSPVSWKSNHFDFVYVEFLRDCWIRCREKEYRGSSYIQENVRCPEFKHGKCYANWAHMLYVLESLKFSLGLNSKIRLWGVGIKDFAYIWSIFSGVFADKETEIDIPLWPTIEPSSINGSEPPVYELGV